MKPALSLFNFLLIVLLSSLIFSCAGTAKMQKGDDLNIETAYLQKEIPGEEHIQIIDYLHIFLQSYSTEVFMVDSVIFQNKAYPLHKSKMQYKVALNKGQAVTNNQFSNISKNMATLFYHKQNKAYYLQIDNIIRKEDLYLP